MTEKQVQKRREKKERERIAEACRRVIMAIAAVRKK